MYGTSLLVQCLGLWASTEGVMGSIPGLGTCRLPSLAKNKNKLKKIFSV